MRALAALVLALTGCNTLAGLTDLDFRDTSPATGGQGGSAGQGEAGGGAGGSGASGGQGGDGAAGEGGSVQGGTGGTGGAPFPTNGILDDFSMPANGPQSDEWEGANASYQRVGGRLMLTGMGAATTYFDTPFGPEQEAFVTLAAIDPRASEMNLVLKAQGDVLCDQLEILYRSTGLIEVWACADGIFDQYGSVASSLGEGDQLGARVTAEGIVSVYGNGVWLGAVDVGAWDFASSAGYIGLSAYDMRVSSTMAWDDFGGGDL
jgi:hypothetical protein